MEFTRVVRRPAVLAAADDIDVRLPPSVPQASPGGIVTRLLPVFMLLAMAGMVVFYFRSGAAAGRSPAFLLFPAMMVISMVASMVYGSRGVQRSGEIDAERRDYLVYLDAVADCVEKTAAEQHLLAHRDHPAPGALWTLVGTDRMWQRRAGDDDFTEVRFGVGSRPLRTRLITAPRAGDEVRDPVTEQALQRLLRDYGTVSGLPVTVTLNRHRRLGIGGSAALGSVRAIICQLAVLHGPDQVRIGVVTGAGDWDWLKWLPHHYRSGYLGGGPLRFSDAAQAAASGETQIPGCHVVLVVDGAGADGIEDADGLTVLVVAESDSAVLDALPMVGPAATERLDELTLVQAECCARRLAGFRAATGSGVVPGDWLSLLGFDAGLPVGIDRRWRGRAAGQRLRVPIGTTEAGEPVELDLKEPAEHGMGPHGLCIGATGSGKSEFLRTLILGLVATHSPAELNLILVDFKGGATFLGFEKINHVAAVITNLAQEAHLVARMRDALAGEMTRRQAVLRAAGNLAGIADYRWARACGADLPPLPALFIVVDEFSELLSQHPDFAELFVAIGRLGRSLGIHLLLASQRLDEGRLRGLETHLSYRVCLKTFSASESRAVIGVADAHVLPGTPGAGFLKTADGRLVRFRTAYVSGGLPSTDDGPSALGLFTATRSAGDSGARQPGPTLLSVVLQELQGCGSAAHQMWLPQLAGPIPAAALLDAYPGRGSMSLPIGLVDNPFHQRYDPLLVDLGGAGGHAVIVGGPRAGKSTALQTLLVGLARVPGPLSIYGLDLGAGALMDCGRCRRSARWPAVTSRTWCGASWLSCLLCADGAWISGSGMARTSRSRTATGRWCWPSTGGVCCVGSSMCWKMGSRQLRRRDFPSVSTWC